MKVKKCTCVIVDNKDGSKKEMEVNFVCDTSTHEKQGLCLYSDKETFEYIEFSSEDEKQCLLCTFDQQQTGDFINCLENFILWIDEENTPLCNEHLNSAIEEGNIFEFTGCGHTLSMWWMPISGLTIYCPKCGMYHKLNGVSYDSEQRHINEFNK